MSTDEHEVFLLRAIALAREHSLGGAGGPFGALVVHDGVVLAEGWNMVTSTNDPTAHAEVVAIRRAAAARRHFSLAGCVMYTSCEPCPMCFGAIHWSRLEALYYGATREDAARIGFDDVLLYEQLALPTNERRTKSVQLLHTEARDAMQAWAEWPERIRY